MNHISKLGYLTGLIVITMSISRWWFMYYDPSQVAIGCSIGIIICGFTYIYDWMRKTNDYLGSIDKRLDAFTDWWGKQELE